DVGTAPCPRLTSSAQGRALNNFTTIRDLLMSMNPIKETPTGESIDAVRADFAAHPPVAGSPPIIVLSTDGLPDTCADANPGDATAQTAANEVAVKAAQAAFTAGIKLFFLFVGDAGQTGDHPQRMANAGIGKDLATGNAPFFVATNPDELTAQF